MVIEKKIKSGALFKECATFYLKKILQKALQYKKKEVSLQTEILNLLGLQVEKNSYGV